MIDGRERKSPRVASSSRRRGWACTTLLLTLAPPSHAFWTPAASSTSSSSPNQLHVFGGFGENDNKQRLPTDIKDAISKCRSAVQRALEGRISRMDIEMPVGANFGVEDKAAPRNNKRGTPSSSTTANLDGQREGLTMEILDKSNRELARLFVEMFQPLGGEHICAVFNDEYLADEARGRWSDDVGAECNILAIDRRGGRRGIGRGGKRQRKKARGFAAILAEELDEGGNSSGPFNLPEGAEVAMFVSPGPKELIAIERVCKGAGMDTCIILLNARLSLVEKYATSEARKLFTEDFEPVWSLSAAPQEEAPGCLMHRAYPGPWVLARKPKVGPPKTIALKEGTKFTVEECADAFGKIEISELEKGTEKIAENVVGWFK
ncbi:hypothetical protein ACHAW5_006649 [Stephanodiscus triporus]|uniref:DUF1995 domain-containing protein n=1 Tax=Stephanodiscus triporus TaxID=2934178 RepID=A0ABD3N312_9STRA